MHLDDKAERLKTILQSYQRVAIAFSGGVDSTLLLKCALDLLGAGNVLVLFGRSDLLKPEEIERVENWLVKNGYPKGVELEIINLHPLSRKEFTSNGEDRCYFCKLRLYTLFRERMEKRGLTILLDGTNIDDLKENRAGLRAIHELGVAMPLVEAGFDKSDVRQYSRQLGLADWNSPSSSCLATRIPQGLPITGERLEKIEKWEASLETFGFSGCRVRMDRFSDETVYVEIAESDFEHLNSSGTRLALLRFFKNNRIKRVFLNLEGR